MSPTTNQRDFLLRVRAFSPIKRTNVLLGIVDALVQAELVPSRYGIADGAARLRFSRDAVVKDATKILEEKTFLAKGPSGLSINLSDWSKPMLLVDLEIGPNPPTVARERWLHAANQLADVMKPDFLTVGWGPSPKVRQGWRDARERTEILMTAGMGSNADYYHVGPRGLGFRTHLCKHYVDILGDEALSTLPARITSRDDGAVCIDVTDDLVTSPFPELVDRREACMRHLMPRDFFCVPRIVEDRCSMWYETPSARFSVPPREKR